jgi:hypothetical protein
VFEAEGPVCGTAFVFDGLEQSVSLSVTDGRDRLRTMTSNGSRISDEFSNVTIGSNMKVGMEVEQKCA